MAKAKEFDLDRPVPVIEGRTLHLFDVGGAMLKLLEQSAVTPTPAAHIAGPFAGVTGMRWMTFDVTDLDAVVAR